MIAMYLLESGALIFLLLGSLHLYYTFFTDKFSSKNEHLVTEMKTSFPLLTRRTTIWKAWIGFNASHSIGAMFIGIMNIYLAANYFSILQDDIFFFAFNIMTALTYLALAKKYWFNIPFTGILLALILFICTFFLTIWG